MPKRLQTRVIRVSEAAYRRLRAQAEECDMPMRVLLDLFLSRRRNTSIPKKEKKND